MNIQGNDKAHRILQRSASMGYDTGRVRRILRQDDVVDATISNDGQIVFIHRK